MKILQIKKLKVVFLLILLSSCKNNNIEISVVENGVLEFNLTKGYGTLLNAKGKVDTFYFHVKKEELQNLNKIYFENKLHKFPAKKFVDPESSDFIFPIEKTRVNILSGKNMHFIQYDDNGKMNSYDRIKDPEVKEFFIEIGKITSKINDSLQVRRNTFIL